MIRRGIALTPVKFGISFTATHYNQAGALVHVYSDGSIHLNHGGCEMGQGLHTKVAQVAAEAFQVDLDQIKVTKTTTEKVPNTRLRPPPPLGPISTEWPFSTPASKSRRG